jgi:hypothetical protein
VRLLHRAASLLVAERVQQADALRHAENEVEARHRRQLLCLERPLAGERVDPLHGDLACPVVTPQLVLGARVLAADQAPKLALAHHALELELASATAHPDAR